ncbi:MAG: biotin/lipoate A/B protein ligase family protein [Halobacteriaceae archaeon]
MRLLRGRAATRSADDAVTGRCLERTADTGERVVRVWRPHKQVVFGRRDTRSDGYDTAREVAEERGYPAVVRRTGGRAAAYTGSTVAFLRTEPIVDVRQGLADRYAAVTTMIQRALWRLGVPAQQGEPDRSFCPGSHSLSAQGKLVGIAQRVTNDAAMVAGTLIVDDHEALGAILDPVYEALGVPFDPDTVGSLARAGGRTEWTAVRLELEGALLSGVEPTVERVDRDQRVE